jgi:hypothetical protein
VQNKIAELQRQAEITRTEYVTRVEFNQFTTAMNGRLDDV